MQFKILTAALLVLGVPLATAQVASHTSTVPSPTTPAAAALAGSDKPVARVNGTTLTERDLLAEMYTLFPYARQHNGFPKQLEPDIRRGALEMIVFEELLYQEALRRKMTVPPLELRRAEADFRRQFAGPDQYAEFLKNEYHGSAPALRERIRRSLLIDKMLRELHGQATVSIPEAKSYYDRNPKEFERPETFQIQTISIIPPNHASAEVQAEARKRADDALRQAKTTKSYREFGLLAEKLSDDDWHVNMGDRKEMARAALPPPIVDAALKMKPGEVSNLLQFGPNFTLFRLNAHTAAGKVSFAKAKTQIQTNLQQAKYEKLRSQLNQTLRKKAKIEIL